MQVSSYDPKKLEEAYGILCRSIHPDFLQNFVPFGLVLCKVLPGKTTAPHNHHENEVFLITSGQGKMQIGEECREVKNGDVVFIPAANTHQLTNSGPDDLDFYSVYWTITSDVTDDSVVEMMIPAPPTPNGALHLGHLSGPYLAADVAHRASSLIGRQSFHVMGTDDYQSYVGAKARDLKCAEKDVIQKFAPKIAQVIASFGSDISYFLKPTENSEYKEFIIRFYQKLKDDKIIKVDKYKAPCCATSNQILYGSAIAGKCPKCKEETGGNGCENCGYYNDAWDLGEAKSTIGEGAIDYVEVERSYIDLEEHREFLEKFIEKISMPAVMRHFYADYLETKLPRVSLSQPASWGIAAPLEEGNVIYEWCEMAGAYLYLVEKMKEEHPNIDFSHLRLNLAFGFDNAFFYGLLIPVLLQNKVAIQSLLTNYFLHLDGEKFSTSRNHAIWGEDILKEIHPDPLRLYLCSMRSELHSTNFRMSHFCTFVENLGEWEHLLETINNAMPVDKLPFDLNGDQKMSEVEERFLYGFNRSCTEIISFYGTKNFRINKVAKLLLDIFEQIHEYYYTGIVASDSDLSLLLLALRRAVALLQPIMPSYSRSLMKSFELDESFSVKTPVDSSSRGKIIEHFPLGLIQETIDSLEKIRP